MPQFTMPWLNEGKPVEVCAYLEDFEKVDAVFKGREWTIAEALRAQVDFITTILNRGETAPTVVKLPVHEIKATYVALRQAVMEPTVPLGQAAY